MLLDDAYCSKILRPICCLHFFKFFFVLRLASRSCVLIRDQLRRLTLALMMIVSIHTPSILLLHCFAFTTSSRRSSFHRLLLTTFLLLLIIIIIIIIFYYIIIIIIVCHDDDDGYSQTKEHC
jgi:hypothetical protein